MHLIIYDYYAKERIVLKEIYLNWWNVVSVHDLKVNLLFEEACSLRYLWWERHSYILVAFEIYFITVIIFLVDHKIGTIKTTIWKKIFISDGKWFLIGLIQMILRKVLIIVRWKMIPDGIYVPREFPHGPIS